MTDLIGEAPGQEQADSLLADALRSEIDQIRRAEVDHDLIEEAIAELRYQFRTGTYQPGHSPLLPENFESPLSLNIGFRADEDGTTSHPKNDTDLA